ncbi:MAG: 6,7-dimethyl-8-ribityllumazine synthase [Chlamydiae bacterium]|nr:6,7-dimethyl-8-ribityllumazine synthase [Chlamydiota bacterium]
MNLSTFKGQLDATGHRFAIVCARFNKPIVQRLLDGALESLERHGATDVTIAWVPGAFEIPLAAKQLAESSDYEAVICLGCVIRGETAHFDHVAEQSAKGILETSLATRLPLIYGVLTTENVEQAERRSGIKGKNLGCEYAEAAIEMVNLFENIANREACV